MAITASDISLRISGGASETDPNAALGGAMSTVGGGIITTDVLNNLMNDITSGEASSGVTLYRGLYWDNEHGSLEYTTPFMWIASQTSSGDTDLAMAIADEAKNVAIETIGSETTAPVGPSFSAPASKGAGIAVGSLDAGDNRGFWLRYTVNAAAAAALDTMTINIEGDSLP